MSRKLDAAIAEALGYKVEWKPAKMDYEGFFYVSEDSSADASPFWWDNEYNDWEIVEFYSTNGNDMLNLDAEMRARGWAIERIQFDSEVNTWSCEYVLTELKHDMLNYVSVEADADTEPPARALAAYKALTGKEWRDN